MINHLGRAVPLLAALAVALSCAKSPSDAPLANPKVERGRYVVKKGSPPG